MDESFRFGACTLDLVNARLLRDGQVIPLPPKALAVLSYLLERRGRLVDKDELLDAVWGRRFVSEGVLKNTIQILRQALEDDPKAPRYIETAHRLGYRFVADVVTGQPALPAASSGMLAPMPPLVGRDKPLADLGQLLAKALRGEPQLVFLSGEPGIGKTALIDAFVHSNSARVPAGHGQCVEQYGQGEPYLPVLEALNDLVKHDEDRLRPLLRQIAPTWLAQLPWYQDADDRALLQQTLAGASQMRMLREFGELLSRCTAERPLILVLEDLHWSDHATLDLLVYLARRRQRARWLLLGSYRPEDVLLSGHPLQHVGRELQIQGLCRELPLALLSEAAIGEYLAHRFPECSLESWAQTLHARTGGLPFFLVQLVETVQDVGDRDAALPEGVQQLLERQFERLPATERSVLEAAGVVGMSFSAEAVAAVLDLDSVAVEEGCERLARLRQFIQPATESGLAGRYGFRHAFYREFAYGRLSPLQRTRLHLRVGAWLERSGARPEDLAAELALHFEQGRDWEKAVHYLQQAANNAVARHAMHEAAGLLRRGLAILEEQLPKTPEQIRRAAGMYATLVTTLQSTQGYGASELEPLHKRALELARQAEDTERLFGLLWGIAIYYLTQLDFQRAFRYAEQLMSEAENIGHVPARMNACYVLGLGRMYLGKLESAHDHLGLGMSLHATLPLDGPSTMLAQVPMLFIETALAMLRWSMGFPDHAEMLVQSALRRSESLGHPYFQALTLMFVAWVAQYRREPEKVLRCGQQVERLAGEHDFAMVQDFAAVRSGWALTIQGQIEAGLARMQQALTGLDVAGVCIAKNYHLGLLAEAQARNGQPDLGLATLTEALHEVERSGERRDEAELYRLQGELLLQASHSREEAESCLKKALAIAREHGAKSWELRAATSLANLWQAQGREDDARELLSGIYNWFSEGFDTPDLRNAVALLDKLGRL